MVTTGTRLGSYEILGALGAGGMGEVYRARDTKLKRDVALKILPDRFAEDADRLATTDPISMAISPDGRRLTFVATSDGRSRLWLRPLDVATAQPLPGTEGASYPFWRPDGSELFYLSPEAMLMAAPIRTLGTKLDPGTPLPLFPARITGPFSGIAGNIRPQYDVAADRFLMNITTEETTSPIAIVLNWQPR